MGPIEQTGGPFIATDGALQRKGKLYNILNEEKDFHFTNGFLPGCSSIVNKLSLSHLLKNRIILQTGMIFFSFPTMLRKFTVCGNSLYSHNINT